MITYGAMQLTLIFSSPASRAAERVRPINHGVLAKTFSRPFMIQWGKATDIAGRVSCPCFGSFKPGHRCCVEKTYILVHSLQFGSYAIEHLLYVYVHDKVPVFIFNLFHHFPMHQAPARFAAPLRGPICLIISSSQSATS